MRGIRNKHWDRIYANWLTKHLEWIRIRRNRRRNDKTDSKTKTVRTS